jgi:hypothetical protein
MLVGEAIMWKDFRRIKRKPPEAKDMTRGTILPAPPEPVPPEGSIRRRLLEALERFLSEIPNTAELESQSPEERAREIARNAAKKAAVFSGGLALPPGPLGYVTIIPDLVGIWKIQAQMVADIAGAFGRQHYLGREQMIYCLFRHVAAQAMRDIVVRAGEHILIRRPALRVVQQVLRKIGVRITQRLAGGAIARWLPIVGVLGVGAYAYYDTGQVAKTAIDLFRHGIGPESPGSDDDQSN